MPYEFDGKKYEKASAHQKEWGMKLIAGLGLQGDEHVLDLGCGDGTLTLQIAEILKKGEVVGIDSSQSMIDAALPKIRNNLNFIVMDINKLNFSDKFDLVLSNATLHWIKNHQSLLENVHRALRTGGRIRFNFAGDGNCSYFFKVIRETMAHDNFAAHFSDFDWPWYMPTVEEYSALVRSSGLSARRVWGENADRHFPNEEAMTQWVDQPSLVPFIAQVPAKDKEAFRASVVRRMIEETKQGDGRCFETFRRINVSAVK